MTDLQYSLQTAGYGFAALLYLVLVTLLLTNMRGRFRGSLLVFAAVTSLVWAILLAVLPLFIDVSINDLFLIEIGHDVAWLVFLTALLSGGVSKNRLWFVRYGGYILGGGLLLFGLVHKALELSGASTPNTALVLMYGSLLTSLYALVAIEQIYRNARQSQRRVLKYLCLALGSIFAYDLFLFSNAVFTGAVSDIAWAARGYVVALCVPLIAVSARRSPDWSVGIFVSRQIVFYTATLFGAGIYLLAVGLAAYYLRYVGGDWGPAAQLVDMTIARSGCDW